MERIKRQEGVLVALQHRDVKKGTSGILITLLNQRCGELQRFTGAFLLLLITRRVYFGGVACAWFTTGVTTASQCVFGECMGVLERRCGGERRDRQAAGGDETGIRCGLTFSSPHG